MAWEIISPSIQILIYWFVFGTIRQKGTVEVAPGVDPPFIYWLMGGFIVWTFFYQSTIQGSKSIYSRLRMLSKMNFPMSIIPNFVIVSQFYVHLFMLAITIIIFQISGYFASIYYLQFLYFIFAGFCLVYSISLITSTLSTIIRDIHMFLNSTLRMGLYVSGVLWPLTILSSFPAVMNIMKLNPIFYLVEGYRAALFGTEWYFITHWESTLIFWGMVIVFFLFGSILHLKFRRHFVDYL